MRQRRNAKVVTAQATCGNFSLQLSRKNRSKLVLGYIPLLDDVSRFFLLRHLHKVSEGMVEEKSSPGSNGVRA